MKINYSSKKHSSLKIYLFLFLAAAFLYIITQKAPLSFDILDTTDIKAAAQRKSPESEIETVEIYQFNSYRETSILKHWYFRQPSDINFIKSFLIGENHEKAKEPDKKSQYKIILNYYDGSRDTYPLWISDNTKKAIVLAGSYLYIDEPSTSKLKDIMELSGS
ncbi:hypothetical protein [Clostridium polynesiense]|uniref:hypothetical protein n=1 Tax=Clostridium polynesiense TaxID=1325933 RepID=UPI00058EECA4|nr:hypothetical protein [Clostridium polynesiense]